MTDTDFRACPACAELTEAGDHFPCADGSAWHVMCYQTAMLEAGEPAPFLPCDYCNTIIWATLPVVRGQICGDDNVWRAGRWHPECAPGEPENAAIPIAPATRERAEPAPVLDRPACIICGKVIARRRAFEPGEEPIHGKCAARRGDPDRTGRPRPHLCVACGRPVLRASEIECDGENGATDYYHKKCYREACRLAGVPDPTAKPKAVKPPPDATIICGICSLPVARPIFREHVVAHESEMRRGE